MSRDLQAELDQAIDAGDSTLADFLTEMLERIDRERAKRECERAMLALGILPESLLTRRRQNYGPA